MNNNAPVVQKQLKMLLCGAARVALSLYALVTIIVFTIMTVLLLTNTWEFIFPPSTSHISVVNSQRDPHLLVNFDVTMLAMPCDKFGLDFVDVSGELALEVSKDVQRIPQSAGGCRIKGFHVINRVQGEFHIAFGREAAAVEVDADIFPWASFKPIEMRNFNTSHVVNHLSFGREYWGKEYPLDHTRRVVTTGSARYLYYINIVPTTYIDSQGYSMNSEQFSFTEHTVPVDFSGPRFWQPGVFFKYEISPYMITVRKESRSFLFYVTSLSAVLGGVYVIAGWLSAAIYRITGAKSFETIVK